MLWTLQLPVLLKIVLFENYNLTVVKQTKITTFHTIHKIKLVQQEIQKELCLSFTYKMSIFTIENIFEERKSPRLRRKKDTFDTQNQLWGPTKNKAPLSSKLE